MVIEGADKCVLDFLLEKGEGNPVTPRDLKNLLESEEHASHRHHFQTPRGYQKMMERINDELKKRKSPFRVKIMMASPPKKGEKKDWLADRKFVLERVSQGEEGFMI